MKIIYHSRDLDGHTSGAILKKKFPHAELIGYDYGEPLPHIAEGDEVILVDVSFKMADMALLAKRCKNFVWIDHHISAMKDFQAAPVSEITPVLNNGISACEGAWIWAFPGTEMPIVVKLLGTYDTWRNQDMVYWEGAVMPFQYGMRNICHSPESFPTEFFDYDTLDDIQDIIEMGNVIMGYQRDQDAQAAKNAFEFEWKGFRVLALNGGGFNSRAFVSAYDTLKHDLMMPFRYNGKLKKWIFSLYTEKDIDCSLLAKTMGGGGHKKASGFEVASLGEVIPGM